MESEVQLPLSLVEKMNDDASLAALRAWGADKSEETLGGALRVHAPYDKQRVKFVKRLETMELQRIIDEYKYQNQADTFWNNFSADKCSWKMVTYHMQQAESEYHQVNVVRRALRHGGCATLQPFVEAIPEDDGLGLLKAGIIILLNAMKRRSQACKIIFDCFRDVPELINSVEQTLGRFSRSEDPEIYCCATRLYSAIVDSLPPLIDHLLRGSGQSKIRQYGSMAKSVVVDEVAIVDTLLQPLTGARIALEQRASRLTEKRQDKMATHVGEIRSETSVIRQNQHQHQHDTTTSLAAINYTTGRIEFKVDTFASVLNDHVAHANSIHEENSALREEVAQLKILNSFHMLTEEKRRNQRFYDDEPRWSHQDFEALSLQPLHTVHNLDQLLQIVCNQIESTSHVTELYSTLQQYQSFSEKALAQAAYLSEKHEFRRWLLERGSGSLLVDGHCSEHISHRMSPISVFCATLVQSLLDMSHTSSSVVLYFFCGQHMNPNGLLFGPQGLIRSLTAQLILEFGARQHQPNLQFLVEFPDLAGHKHPEDIDIRTMCRVFTALLGQLPPGTTVHYVVDGISHFETVLYGLAGNMRIVVDCLQSCVLNTDISVYMKVLLSSADASTVVRNMIHYSQQVDLRSGDYYGSVASPRALTMDLSSQLSFSALPGDEQSGREHSGAVIGRYGNSMYG